MIFVTVGTHEQPFNRLGKYMDKWSKEHEEEVVIQTGCSTYNPKYCEWRDYYSFSTMLEMVKKARIVITHGGPSSYIMPLQIGKIPIVVPRKKIYNEHVNDHQVNFCEDVSKRQGNIIVVEDIKKLGYTLESYDEIVQKMNSGLISNNRKFCSDFGRIIEEIVN